MLRSVTHGQLTALLSKLGFKSRVIDDHSVVYEHKPSDSLFFLPNCPPDTPARPGDYGHIRSGLDWRGLMSRDEFEEHFALLFAETHRARTKQA